MAAGKNELVTANMWTHVYTRITAQSPQSSNYLGNFSQGHHLSSNSVGEASSVSWVCGVVWWEPTEAQQHSEIDLQCSLFGSWFCRSVDQIWWDFNLKFLPATASLFKFHTSLRAKPATSWLIKEVVAGGEIQEVVMLSGHGKKPHSLVFHHFHFPPKITNEKGRWTFNVG